MLDYLLESLGVERVENLFPHEQTIPDHLKRLELAIKSDNRLLDPLLVDRKSKVILDGNHRRKVLENLGLDLAVCQEVDYESEVIKLGGWFPLAKVNVNEIKKNLKNAEKVDFNTGMRDIQNLKGVFLLAGDKDCYLIPSEKKSLDGILQEQAEVLEKLNGRKIDYIADDLANIYRKQGVVFYRKILKKKDVVGHAKKGKLFPPKSTRHMVSRRIIRLDISLDWLNLTADKAKALLEKVIIERYKKHQVRYYAEPVILMKY